MTTSRPTIKDVAQLAGVSHATVSYVLGGSPHAARISDETKLRIWRAAERLGYKSNPVGRALKRGYMDTITLLIVSWQMAKSHSQTAMAISRAAGARGLQVTVQVVDSDRDAAAFLARGEVRNSMGLLVLWDSPAMQSSGLAKFVQEGIPVVDLMPCSPDGIGTVTADREHAGYSVTRHLIDLGHTCIGMIGDTDTRGKTTSRKLAGYRRALDEAGLDFDPDLVRNVSDFGFEGGQTGFRELAERCSDVTAVFCINDPMALGAIACAESLGRKCPSDISVAGYGAFDEGAYWRPSLTTVSLSADKVAARAIDEILRLRADGACEPATIYVPGELLIRESTGGRVRMEEREEGSDGASGT